MSKQSKSTIAKLCRMLEKLPQPFPAYPDSDDNKAEQKAYDAHIDQVCAALDECLDAYADGVVGYETLSDIAHEILSETDAREFCGYIKDRFDIKKDYNLRPIDMVTLGYIDETNADCASFSRMAITALETYQEALEKTKAPAASVTTTPVQIPPGFVRLDLPR